jgi:two-component system sensor histidine kinase BarA
MSYRTFKRLLGETNFEVKCLVLFGFGLSLLAVLTLALYWWQTSSLIEDHYRTTARLLIAPMIIQRHQNWPAKLKKTFDEAAANQGEPEIMPETSEAAVEKGPMPIPPEPPELPPDGAIDDGFFQFLANFTNRIDKMAPELQPEHLRDFKFDMVQTSDAEAFDRPSGDMDYAALSAVREGDDEFVYIVEEPPNPEDGDDAKGKYHFYSAIRATESCLVCHRQRQSENGPVALQEGDLLGMAKISLPLETIESARHQANAFVITSEFIKVVLAIVAIYLVVRYVITKPVLHLKKVSDAIAHGNLDMRADIRTGDEFEELSHAFNRMLRHLVTVQDELREVNADLDGKVDELAQVNLKLYETNNMKNEFLATMSHELRTPLNSILGFSDVLCAADNLDERQQRYASNIATSGKSLMALINDVLDLAKIESGKMDIHPAEFTVEDLIERHAATMIPIAERRNIALSSSVEPNLPKLFQDPGKLQQILNNLLSNAIKFTPEGGRVRVSAEKRDSKNVALIVEDNGIGIPLDEQERIFEKFRQGKGVPGQEDALTRKYEGTGLGLSIVKELSLLLGGEVSLESEFGKGSTFSVVVPLILEKTAAVDEAATAQLVGLNRFRTVDLPKSDLPQSAGSESQSADSPLDETAEEATHDQPDGETKTESVAESQDAPGNDDSSSPDGEESVTEVRAT